MIIWLNGGFGAGKSTMAAELHRRMPEAVVYDAEIIRSRLRARAVDRGFGPGAASWTIDRLDPGAASRQPDGTVVLRSDLLGPGQLAEAVLAVVGRAE